MSMHLGGGRATKESEIDLSVGLVLHRKLADAVEAGESLAACAEREIAEETGIAARVERPLCETLHAYWFAKTARWELKRTHWFRLRPAGAGTPAPQTEEGIERVSWCAPAEREEHLRDAFPTIRRVAAAMEE